MEVAVQDGGGEALSEVVVLCRLDDLDDPGTKGFEKIDGQAPFFVVRRGDAVFGYRNFCPHYGAPLDWKPDAFLSYDRAHILCSMHGALFGIQDGICIKGPCPGDALEQVDLQIKNGNICLV